MRALQSNLANRAPGMPWAWGLVPEIYGERRSRWQAPTRCSPQAEEFSSSLAAGHCTGRATCFIPDLTYVSVWRHTYLSSTRSLGTGILLVVWELSECQPNGVNPVLGTFGRVTEGRPRQDKSSGTVGMVSLSLSHFGG